MTTVISKNRPEIKNPFESRLGQTNVEFAFVKCKKCRHPDSGWGMSRRTGSQTTDAVHSKALA